MMNRSNLSWVDNKVLGGSGNGQNRPAQNTAPPRPVADTMPAQYQAMQGNQNQTGLSPSASQDPMANMPVQSGQSPCAYQDSSKKEPAQHGVSPSPYQEGAAFDPARMFYPGETVGDTGSYGTLTRDDAYAINPFNIQGPPSTMSPGYTPAYLKSQIGKQVRAEFNIGANLYIDKTGFLREVGVNYFVLEDTATHAMVMCDLYSMKFLTSV